METKERKPQSGDGNTNSIAIIAIVAIFVLVLGTVMLFAQDDGADSAKTAGGQQQKESFAFELESDEGSVRIESGS